MSRTFAESLESRTFLNAGSVDTTFGTDGVARLPLAEENSRLTDTAVMPDGRFVVGPSRRVPGFACAVGCNAHGVSGSAGIGRHLVEALTEARPSPYVRSLSPDRFAETSWTWPEAERRARRVLETYYHVGH